LATFLTLLFIAFALLASVLLIGKIKGNPHPKTISMQEIFQRIDQAETWIKKYRGLPESFRSGAGIKKQHREKLTYLRGLQIECLRRGVVARGKEIQETMLPAMYRQVELMKSGVSEEDAIEAVSREFGAPISINFNSLLELVEKVQKLSP
jgi:hypothetical protein